MVPDTYPERFSLEASESGCSGRGWCDWISLRRRGHLSHRSVLLVGDPCPGHMRRSERGCNQRNDAGPPAWPKGPASFRQRTARDRDLPLAERLAPACYHHADEIGSQHEAETRGAMDLGGVGETRNAATRVGIAVRCQPPKVEAEQPGARRGHVPSGPPPRASIHPRREDRQAQRQEGMTSRGPWFVLVAGINGAGKSTFAQDPASIRELCGLTGAPDEIEIINPDIITREILRENPQLSLDDANKLAADACEARVRRLVEGASRSFVIETVLSTDKYSLRLRGPCKGGGGHCARGAAGGQRRPRRPGEQDKEAVATVLQEDAVVLAARRPGLLVLQRKLRASDSTRREARRLGLRASTRPWARGA